ncbi:hypothetical protein OH77DRAFT_1525653 [Trametes cingulata]|nr:hypothetical protein OH77DRAFT_1525653 [Trametes cingulata]
MVWQTYYTCLNAEFCLAETINGIGSKEDLWRPANVSVTAPTDTSRWLMVTLQRDRKPVIWRVIKEDWMVICDERTLTMTMQCTEPDGLTINMQKLRFRSRPDFWSFLAHLAFSRVHAYTGRWVDPTVGRPVQSG